MATKTAPSPLIKKRLSRVNRQMKAKKLAGVLITNPKDYFYLTGFTGEDSAVLLTGKDVHVITDGRFDEVSKAECAWATVWLREGLLNAEIVNVCKKLKIRRLAVQADHMTIAEQDAILEISKGLRLTSAPPLTGGMREIKDEVELRWTKKSIKVAQDAFLAMRDSIRIGQTEIEMAARLEYEMKKRGSSVPSFTTICAEGPNAALPHAHPGTRKVKKGSAVLFDWGATVGNYCSDLTRMVFVGSIPPKIAEIYDVVLQAQVAAIKAIKPGRRMCDVDKVARDLITDAGFGKQFNHGLGHGLGLDIHEAPSLSWRSDAKLKAGMIVTVEPGIYLPGVGGVRIEDDVLVTPKGVRVLTNVPKTLADSVIRARK